VRHVFSRMLEKTELRQIRIHDLRHTFASLLLRQGESIVYVKEQLGHASIQITVDVRATDPWSESRRLYSWWGGAAQSAPCCTAAS
jgi:integrase